MAQTPDPYAWLEDIHSPRAMAWVEQQNARTAKVLEADPRFETYRREALAIFTAKDRIAYPEFLGEGIANLWQDQTHANGVWRRASEASYLTSDPAWETLLDLDALSKTEGKNWFFKGATCLPPSDRLCLVRLSNGGGDAVEIREFDTVAKAFVPGGFELPSGKQNAAWLDENTLIVSRDWGPGTLTTSGYPFVVKQVKRGEALSGAAEIYRGAPDDVSVMARTFRDPKGAVALVVIERAVTPYHSDYFVLEADGRLRRIDLPAKSNLHGYVAGRLVVSLDEDWPARNGHGAFSAGSLVAFDARAGDAQLIILPTASQTINEVWATQNRLLVELLDNVNGTIEAFAPTPQGWSGRRLDFPAGSALTVRAADKASDRAFIVSESFLEPPTLWRADAVTGEIARIKSLPAQFDASKDVTEQHFATSADGTRIPYFLVRPKAMKADGSTPVQMFGYGGFLVSETPSYRPEVGKLWLERGGAYVLANIRGGGEFGPTWHDAALRENRQRAFDDFAAVARDLIARGLTSPRRLGIYGRSNGGVLTSVSITQHSELFNAAVIESPLIDMLRYTKLSAGASWAAEYGDPDVPADRAFIARYSAYQNLKAGVKYPQVYITTNTEDDRVHPGHARKFAAALQALGDPALYYENTFGGHANDADPQLNARRWARHYVYLAQKLMD